MYDPVLKERFVNIIRGAFPYEKTLKEHGLTQEDVEEFREMMYSSEYFPRAMLDKFLLLVLIACNKRLDKCVNLMHNYLKSMKESPEFFHNRVYDDKGVQQALKNQYFFSLPPTPKNYNLVFYRLQSTEPKNYVFDDSEKVLLMTVETCLFNNGPRDGTVFLCDMKGAKAGHLLQPKLNSLKKLLKMVQDGCPFRIREIHVLNTVPFLDAILAMIKPFIRSHLMNRVHFHSTNLNYEKFYEEWIPKSCLPSDYGGDLDSIEELHEEHRPALKKMSEFFLLQERLLNFEFEEYNFDEHRDENTQM